MTLAVTIGFADFVLTLGDGGSPETFVAPCAFNSRAMNFTKNLTEIVIPDCDDETHAGWIVRDPLSLSWDISGEGLLDVSAIQIWDEWFLQVDAKKIKVTITKPDDTTIVYSGQGHLQTFSRSANRAEELMFTCAIAGSGPLTRTPPPALLARSFLSNSAEIEAEMQRRENRRARHAARAEAEAKPAKGKAKDREAA